MNYKIDKEHIEKFAVPFLQHKLKERGCEIKHAGFFVYLMEKNRSLRWSPKFGLPRKDTMKALRIKNRRTYYKLFDGMVMTGLVNVVEKSNPHDSVVITIMTQDFWDFVVSKNKNL